MVNRKYRILLPIILLSSILINCSGSSSSSSNKSNPILPISSSQLSISKSTIFPISSGSGAEYYLKFTNDSDRELNLVSSQTSRTNNVKSLTDDDIVNISYCNKVNAKQSCYITITPPANPGSLVLNLNYQDKYRNNYKVTTLVNYADIAVRDGFRINSDLVTVLANKVSNIVAIPFKLEENFTHIGVNTNMPVYDTEIKCTNSSYVAGTYCTAFVNVKPGEFTSNVSVVGILNGQNVAVSLPLNVSLIVAGNLVTNTNSIIIRPGESGKLVLFNNGTAPVSSINVDNSLESKLSVLQNNCPSSLAVESSCTITLKYNGTLNGAATIFVNYAGGLVNPTTIIPVNVIYYALIASPGLSLIATNNFVGTKINESRTTVLTLSNNSTSSTVIKLESVSKLPIGFVYDNNIILSGSGCLSKESLAKGESCQYGIRYNAPNKVESGILSYFVRGSYILPNSAVKGTIVAGVSIPYSSVNNGALLDIIPAYGVRFSIIANGQAKQTQTYTVMNKGDGPALQMSLGTLPTYFNKELASTCREYLSVGESCTYVVTFGPLTESIANTSESLKVRYFKYNGGLQQTLSSNFSYYSSLSILIQMESFKLLNSPAYGWNGGLGTESSPYIFTPSPNNYLLLSTKYKNSGTESAVRFNVAVNTLPIGYYIDNSTTCPNGNQVGTLLPNESCTLVIGLVDERFMVDDFYLPAISSTLDVLGYSYMDNTSGFNVFGPDSSKRLYINTAKWGNLSSDAQVYPESKSLVLNIQVISVDTNVATGVLTAVADTTQLPGLIGSSTCSINNGTSGSCQIVLNYDAALPSGIYSLPISLSAGGQVSALKLKNTVTFMLP